MDLFFEKCQPGDIVQIIELDNAAIAFQKTVSHLHWQPFDPEIVQQEIEAGRYWKIIESGQIVFLFVMAFSDPAIWGERSNDKAIYLHRFVTNPAFRGRGYVNNLTEWAKNFAREKGLDFVRLDTWTESTALCSYYESCGFQATGKKLLEQHPALSPHYWGITVRLFEIKV